MIPLMSRLMMIQQYFKESTKNRQYVWQHVSTTNSTCSKNKDTIGSIVLNEGDIKKNIVYCDVQHVYDDREKNWGVEKSTHCRETSVTLTY